MKNMYLWHHYVESSCKIKADQRLDSWPAYMNYLKDEGHEQLVTFGEKEKKKENKETQNKEIKKLLGVTEFIQKISNLPN